MELQLRQAIAQVQQGEECIRDRIIQKYLPFILKVASKSCKRYVRLGEDDEVSIALMAFNEALDKFDCKKNNSFFGFAQAVIKRRMIDYFRKNSQNKKEIPWSSLGTLQDDEDPANQLDRINWQNSQEVYFEDDINQLRREEIIEYQKELLSYGISLKDLVEASPKHRDARASAYKVARLICDNDRLSSHLKKTKSLPLKDLEGEVEISRKTMERQRKYIIALAVVMIGRYYFLEEYLEGIKKEG